MGDKQQLRLYAAEQVIRDGARQFRSLEKAQVYVDKIVASDWWKDRSSVTEVKVFLGRKDSRTARAYRAGRRWRGMVQPCPFITIPPSWAATSAVILHELAHVITEGGESHGPEFCHSFLAIVREHMGVVAERKLKASMENHSVCFTVGDSTKSNKEVASKEARLSRDQLVFLQQLGMA